MPKHTPLSKRVVKILATVLMGNIVMLFGTVAAPSLAGLFWLFLALISGIGLLAIGLEVWDEVTYRWRKFVR